MFPCVSVGHFFVKWQVHCFGLFVFLLLCGWEFLVIYFGYKSCLRYLGCEYFSQSVARLSISLLKKKMARQDFISLKPFCLVIVSDLQTKRRDRRSPRGPDSSSIPATLPLFILLRFLPLFLCCVCRFISKPFENKAQTSWPLTPKCSLWVSQD